MRELLGLVLVGAWWFKGWVRVEWITSTHAHTNEQTNLTKG